LNLGELELEELNLEEFGSAFKELDFEELILGKLEYEELEMGEFNSGGR